WDSENEKLLKIAEENGVKNRVHFLNSIPYNDVVHFISGADLAVVPIYATSLNSEHSALNKISQALMAGLPLVTSNYNNLNNLINNDSYYIGETFDVTDSLSIANAVNRLLEKNLSVVKETSRKIALEKVNWDSENEKLLKIYIELFKPRKKSKHV
ncbi:MAG: glycosyltransferase, partial [Bacteroidota bacterium]